MRILIVGLLLVILCMTGTFPASSDTITLVLDETIDGSMINGLDIHLATPLDEIAYDVHYVTEGGAIPDEYMPGYPWMIETTPYNSIVMTNSEDSYPQTHAIFGPADIITITSASAIALDAIDLITISKSGSYALDVAPIYLNSDADGQIVISEVEGPVPVVSIPATVLLLGGGLLGLFGIRRRGY